MVAQELQDTLRDITMMGYGLILICHSKEKASSIVDSEGNNLMSVEPDLSKNVYTICNAICDLIAYIDVEFDEHGVGKRWIYTRATPTIFAGSRWKYLDPKIPFSYEELVAAIGRAIHQAANEDGVSVAEHTETVAIKNRPFQEIMDEARTLWQAYMDNVANDEEREQHYNIVKDIIKRIFGTEEFKLSQAVPSQGDLVEYFISELKDIMKPE